MYIPTCHPVVNSGYPYLTTMSIYFWKTQGMIDDNFETDKLVSAAFGSIKDGVDSEEVTVVVVFFEDI
ncbi:hypothetical protein BpHYR1_042346 [Brachionus plicatilis]|uniref:Uncharacterized protein n=1 Tax=Brachionus plicatilis TaxID=10195 RepID=A0A3M7SV65_BRAPC|nr:hypothetical protein BpHYR1_042346 [Brachionus plicatilis]